MQTPARGDADRHVPFLRPFGPPNGRVEARFGTACASGSLRATVTSAVRSGSIAACPRGMRAAPA
jgi:hypothetical protein